MECAVLTAESAPGAPDSAEGGIVGQISAAPRAPVSNYVKLCQIMSNLCQIALNVKFFAGPAVSNFSPTSATRAALERNSSGLNRVSS